MPGPYNAYVVTQLGAGNAEFVIEQSGAFIQKFTTLALALAWLATVLVSGDTVQYLIEPTTTTYT